MPSSGLLTDKSIRSDTVHTALPEGYGETMAAMLPRDPNWIFIYWEITESSTAKITNTHGPDIYQKSRQVLRIHDMTNSGGEGGRYFDVPVRFDAGSWYVHVPDEGRCYCGELGLITPSGAFVGIVKSNTVTLPPGRISDVMDARWMTVSEDFDKLLQLSGVEYIGKGSGEVAKSLAQRWEMLRAMFSRSASWGISSLASQAPRPEQKKFWLVADCELILYGATEPDAFVTVSGRRVKLNPDGTFSMRFALTEGNTNLPIMAMSKDETEIRQIGISVDRATATI